MLSLLIFLTILILKAEASPPDNDFPTNQNLTDADDHMDINTHFAMLQSILRSHNPGKNLRDSNKFSCNDSRVNELEYLPLHNDSGNPLLVGFAGDPFRYSTSEDDYLKGMRNMELQIYKNKTGNRDKRGIVNFYNIISCATDCDPFRYNGYGCYCGFGGDGIATDAIDSCCQAHDECYNDINRPWYVIFLQPYFWQCNYGEPQCGVENEHPAFKSFFSSAGKLCECDRKFVMCLKKYRCPETRAVCSSSAVR